MTQTTRDNMSQPSPFPSAPAGSAQAHRDYQIVRDDMLQASLLPPAPVGSIQAYRDFQIASGLVPVDLPPNVPDPDKYPYARYGGLVRFCQLLPNDVMWDFIVDLGGRRDETSPASFWTKAFNTGRVLEAYFKLKSVHRVYFVQNVVWIRDPLPGRPGGVQIPPPEWPGNLPTPVHHVMTRYAGLADWVATLADNWQEVARMALFGVHEPFDRIWWADYHKTVDVYTLYARLSPALRENFEESVYWVPDGPPPNRPSDVSVPEDTPATSEDLEHEEEDGYCYLDLFRAEHRATMRTKLGRNPWASAVAGVLLGEPGIWQTGTFEFTIRTRQVGHGHPYLQAHVKPAAGGTPMVHILPYFTGPMRVGATSDLNAMANLQLQDDIAAKPTLFPTRAVGGGAGLPMVYSVYARLDKTNNQLAWHPLDHEVFSWLLGAFESVRVEDVQFEVQVSTGAQNSLLCAICGPSTDLNTPSDWYATPVNAEIHGSDAGYVFSSFGLPKVHPFDPEMRSPNPTGNPPPSFRFNFAGAVGGKAVIRGTLRVKVNGQSALGHIDIGPQAPKKTAARMRAALVESLTYNVDGETNYCENEDEMDSDDDEPAAPSVSPPAARRSPAQATSSRSAPAADSDDDDSPAQRTTPSVTLRSAVQAAPSRANAGAARSG